MARFLIDQEADIRDELKRLIRFRIDMAWKRMQGTDDEKWEHIHEFRKDMKKIRAILRMFRDSVHYHEYFRENRFYRDLARRFSEPRDCEVMYKQAHAIVEKLPENARNEKSEHLVNTLKKESDLSLEKLSQKGIGEDALKKLSTAARRLDEIQISNRSFKVVRTGIMRMYRQSRRYLNTINSPDDLENIHNLRKRCKYLGYQISVIRPVFPAILQTHKKVLKEVSERLGHHRDLSLFLIMLNNRNYLGLSRKQQDYIEKFTADEKDRAFHEAIEPAEKFFVNRPSVYTDIIENYYLLSIKYSH